MDYHHILLAVDPEDDNTALIARGRELARRFKADLSLAHVVEYFPVDPASETLVPTPVSVEQELVDEARKQLRGIARALDITDRHIHVRVGTVRREIAQLATEQQVDLIVVGRHQRHGLGLMLGSTGTAVLRAAPCDVLAVHLG